MATRRVFLQTVAVLGAAGACGSCGGLPSGISGDVAAGSLKDLPLGTLRAVNNQPVAIGHDANGVYAMSLICTHQGCDMSVDGGVSANGAYCSCHGSTFDANGNPRGGPARSPLSHYAVSKDATGNLTIHGGDEVAASVRLAV